MMRVRLPPDLKAEIARAAREANRSMNAEIVARLRRTVEVEAAQPDATAAATAIQELLRVLPETLGTIRESLQTIAEAQQQPKKGAK